MISCLKEHFHVPPEVDDGERRSPARVVDDVPDDALDVAIPLAVVNGPEPGRSLAVLGVRHEHGAGALALSANHATHPVAGGGGPRKLGLGARETGRRRPLEMGSKPEKEEARA